MLLAKIIINVGLIGTVIKVIVFLGLAISLETEMIADGRLKVESTLLDYEVNGSQ